MLLFHQRAIRNSVDESTKEYVYIMRLSKITSHVFHRVKADDGITSDRPCPERNEMRDPVGHTC